MDQSEPQRRRFAPYTFIVTIPDRVYPFSSYIDGERVRWRRSYEHTLGKIQEEFGVGIYGAKLIAYRELFHIFGAGILILGGTYLSHLIWGSDVALPVLFILAMLVITYQEFVLQPRTYNQHLGKSVLDWVTWVAPLSIYLILFLN